MFLLNHCNIISSNPTWINSKPSNCTANSMKYITQESTSSKCFNKESWKLHNPSLEPKELFKNIINCGLKMCHFLSCLVLKWTLFLLFFFVLFITKSVSYEYLFVWINPVSHCGLSQGMAPVRPAVGTLRWAPENFTTGSRIRTCALQIWSRTR